MNKRIIYIEHHSLVLKYANIRLPSKKMVHKIADSIERHGQIVPTIVVSAEQKQLILIDGYVRVNALKQLGLDTIKAEIWNCDEPQALLSLLADKQGRTWETIEESLFMRELQIQHGLSQQAIAKRIGRDRSWVNRRLALLENLPDAILNSVISGSISTWVATRILSPVARATPEHARLLANYLCRNDHPSREINQFYEHYKKSNKQTRGNMISQPDLFFKSQKIANLEQDAQKIKEGPEGKWKKWFNIINSLLVQLTNICPEILYPQQIEVEKQELLKCFDKAQSQFKLLIKTISEL